MLFFLDKRLTKYIVCCIIFCVNHIMNFLLDLELSFFKLLLLGRCFGLFSGFEWLAFYKVVLWKNFKTKILCYNYFKNL